MHAPCGLDIQVEESKITTQTAQQKVNGKQTKVTVLTNTKTTTGTPSMSSSGGMNENDNIHTYTETTKIALAKRSILATKPLGERLRLRRTK